MTKSRLLTAVAVVGSINGTAAWAQTEPSQADGKQQATGSVAAAGSTQFDDIIVTARRRDESVSRVPLSIKALGSAELEQRGIQTEADLQRSVPGLTIRETQHSNTLTYAIRGQTVDGFSSSQPGVLSYVNDVQITNLSASSFYDIESIQVVKGPQGTLFGRNTTGGAVLFSTAKPANDFSGNITARVGNYSRREVEGHINVPLVDDEILLRVSGRFTRRDGYIHNLTTGGDVGRRDLGTDDSQSGRVSLLLRPFDGFENITMVQYTDVGGTTAGGVLYSLNQIGGDPSLNVTADFLYSPTFNPVNFGAYVAANPQAFPGGMSAYLALQKSRGPYKANFNSPSFYESRNPSVTNTTTYKIGDNLVLKNIFGFNDSKYRFSTDADGTPYTIYNLGPFGQTIGQRGQNRQYSEEFQIQGKAFDDSLNYIVGLYYSNQKLSFNVPQSFFELAPNQIFPGNVNTFRLEFDSYALFTQGTYNLASLTGVDGLSLTAGIRYTIEKASQTRLAGDSFFVAGAGSLKKTFKDPSWTFGLEYQATPSLLLYATQRGSWRTGGFNGFRPPVPGLADVGGSEFKSETTRDVEVGAKFDGSLGGRPFRLSVAGYNQWAKNLQRVVYVVVAGAPAATTASVPKAQVTGVELDSEYRPVDWLTLGLGAAYTNARFTDNIVNLFGVTNAFGPYPDTPKFTTSAFAQIKLPVPIEIGEISLRGDLYHQTKFFFSSTNSTITPNTELPSYTAADFRLNWNDIAGTRISGALFVTNAFDKTFYTGGTALGSVFGLNVAIPGKPRMYGLQLGIDF